ncbi:stage II sporulation protein R [Bacillus piscicola]|uniref:stage II sporulation protein R n=1 Tax=Bacillus piscicola TaxID=1632684 RepID=UPI001F091E73|nr:stage II sporulation protein R [Bacillus piscicola]
MRNKKALFYIIFLMVLVFIQMEQQQEASASISQNNVIPDEAIRLRILAHDDSPGEQLLKREVRDAVNEEIRGLVAELDNKKEARTAISEAGPTLETIVQETLDRLDSGHDFSLKLATDVEFPTRIYGPLIYPAGSYEALVITIGEGEGANWWCVLFPPLCFIPADNEAQAVDNQVDKAENVEKNAASVDDTPKHSFFIVEKWKDWFG